MKVHFYIEYNTRGEDYLRICIKKSSRESASIPSTLVLTSNDASHWEGEIELTDEAHTFEYRYEVMNAGKVVRMEWHFAPRLLQLSKKVNEYFVKDLWKDISAYSYLYSYAFTDNLLKREKIAVKQTEYATQLVLHVSAPQLQNHHALALLGNQPALGNWALQKAILLEETSVNEWTCNLNAELLCSPLEFKFIVINKDTKELLYWEEDENRKIDVPLLALHQTFVMQLGEAKFPISPWHGAGMVIPLFSLRSEESYGVGDLGDLKKMIDWALLTNMQVIQLLPINDTTNDASWRDSYPYNAISVYAIHPQYIDISQLPVLDDANKMLYFKQQQKELNALPQIDYVAVNQVKQEYLRLLYRQEGLKTTSSKGYKQYVKANEHWLLPYASFCYLRELYGSSDFTEWPKYTSYSEKEIASLCMKGNDSYKEIGYYYFVQYLLHRQMSEAAAYARSKRVVLKGDIPIGINRAGVEAWSDSYYFNFDGQAGAPPDDFSLNGQNWGFPTYNWEQMSHNNYLWWQNRLKNMANYFDAFRIDHILGFFRIWEIPLNSIHGLLGQFSPALPMSAEEISNYGLKFDKERFTKPYITRMLLRRTFGKETDEVTKNYFSYCGGNLYALKPSYDTQRKVEAAFRDLTDKASRKVCEGLYALISNVLFVVDRKDSNKYHPRILAQQNSAMQMLSPIEQEAYKQLYDDYFYHRQNDFWYHEAMKKLPVITQASRMLACGEDLGMVPQCVPWVMEGLRILSLEIQRMPKKWNYVFGNLSENPYLSVTTISTHDMPTLRAWWEEDANRARNFYNDVLGYHGKPPVQLTGKLAKEVICMHLQSPSMLCLLAWQDWMALDEKLRYPDAAKERINEPANSRHYWRYRMHLTIEELMKQQGLNKTIATLIKESGRG